MLVDYTSFVLATSYINMHYEVCKSIECATALRNELAYLFTDSETIEAMTSIIESVSNALNRGTIEVHHILSLNNIILLANCLLDSLDELDTI